MYWAGWGEDSSYLLSGLSDATGTKWEGQWPMKLIAR